MFLFFLYSEYNTLDIYRLKKIEYHKFYIAQRVCNLKQRILYTSSIRIESDYIYANHLLDNEHREEHKQVNPHD